MANNEAERESLLWRRVSKWKPGNSTGSNAVPLTNIDSKNLHVKQILDQPNMQPNQQVGNALQQWRLGLNQQPQRFPQTIPGALSNPPMVYTAQTRPPTAPFIDTDAAAALAAARNRISQNQQQHQNQRPDPPVEGTSFAGPSISNPCPTRTDSASMIGTSYRLYSGRPDTNAANAASPNAAAAAAAVLARVRQQQQQGIPNPQAPNPQQHLMPTNPLTDDRWKALNNRPQLSQPLHLPSMPLHPPGAQPVRPPAMMGPQMPTPFPSQVAPTLMRPPFSISPPAPNRPSILNDQPRLAALMAEYNNRLGPAQRQPMMPTDFGVPRPMIAPRQTLPMTLPTPRAGMPIYPVTNVPNKPLMPGIPPVCSLPANLYPSPRPVLPNFNLPGSVPTPPVPNGLLNFPPQTPIGMGWPDARMPPVPVHPSLVRSNSAPPIPPQQFFNPVVHFSQMHNMPQLSVPMMTFPLAEGMLFPDHSAHIDGGVSDTFARTSPKLENKEECGASGSEGTDDEYKQQQRPLSADSMVRRCNSASHGDVDAEGRSHRRQQSASPSQSSCVWNAVSESIRCGQYVDKAEDETPTEKGGPDSHDPTHDKLPISNAPIELVKESSVEVFPARDVVEAESLSRAVVISDFNRYGHGALVEDTIEAMSNVESTPASSKHRKIATPRNPRRRVRPSLSNNALAPADFGNSSPAASLPPESNSTDPTIRVHFKDTEVESVLPKGKADGDVPKKPQLPFFIPSFIPAFPSAKCSVLLSLQYAKIVIVFGLVLPLTELLSPYISTYRGFYLYLYMGSILFMIYINVSAVWKRRVRLSLERRKDDSGRCAGNRICAARSRLPRLRFKKNNSEQEDVRYGSVYLRIGLNAFGIGSMVYCGLEIAHEIEQWTLAPSLSSYVSHGDRSIRLLLPACRAILTIFQMHFILFNENASEIRRQRAPARIGLAHMIATNVCEWLAVVVQETRHELDQLNIHPGVNDTSHVQVLEVDISNSFVGSHNSTLSNKSHGIVAPLLHSVAPLLSPCTIEYSLICAVLLFEMWKEVGQSEDDGSSTVLESSSNSSVSGANTIGDSPVTGAIATVSATGSSISGTPFPGGGTRTRGAHHLSADLTHTQRGAFGGVLLLVLTFLGVALLSAQRSKMITNTDKIDFSSIPFDAILEAILSITVIIGVLVVAFTTRKLTFTNAPLYPLPMDLFLLVIAQTSAYVYSLFVIIGCYVLLRNGEEPNPVHCHAALIMAVEVLSTFRAYAQTHVIVRTWQRRPMDSKQAQEKPGRQAVTFLLLANLCLWTASTFGSARAQRLPHHMRIFGVLPWTAIAHACLPLTIFLHLHSSICLFELWKNCYKFRSD